MKRSNTQEKALFGDQGGDWTCPICHHIPSTPLIACPECGCHILLTVKIRRLHDSLLQKGNSCEGDALFRDKQVKKS